MIEPELAFSDLTAVMNNAELFMKHVISYTLKVRQMCHLDSLQL